MYSILTGSKGFVLCKQLKKIDMTSEEKAKEVLKLQEEINEIKRFCDKLEAETCRTGKGVYAFIDRKTTSYFLGKWKTKIVSETIPIPDKINLEINASCLKWIEELERRIEQLIPTNQ